MTRPLFKKSMYEDPDRPCLGKLEVFFAPDWLINRRGRWDPMPAKVICFGCEHKSECLETALDPSKPLHFGVWGGQDEEQRRRIMKCRRGECPPLCRHVYREKGAA